MKIINSYLTKNPFYTAGKRITVKKLMLHSVGCSQPSASVFVRNWNKETYTRACVHAFIDGNSGEVFQTLPWNYRAGHSGGSANDYAIGVEMCEPACIKYTGKGAEFTVAESDLPAARKVALRTYNSAVELFAHLCTEYKLDPLADILSHKEGGKRGIASGHADPEHLWEGLGLDLTMDTFRKAVEAKMNENNNLYYVQLGAFGSKAGAEKKLAEVKAAGFSDAFVTTMTGAPAKAPAAAPALKVGDAVKMQSGAPVYGTSKKFADWVYNSTLYVRQIDGSRAVISTVKTGAVTGSVDKKYLTKKG